MMQNDADENRKIIPAGCAEQPPTEINAVLYNTAGEEAGGLTVRYYEETPHVPYLGITLMNTWFHEDAGLAPAA